MSDIVIKKYSDIDSLKLYKITSDEVFTWLPYGPFSTIYEMQSFYECLSKKCELYTVFKKDMDEICGVFAIKNISKPHKKCEIGHIWYGIKYQKTNVNTEAIFLALTECFDNRKYRRVSWKCDNLNKISRNCALRLGFKYEGLFLNDQIVKGKNKNTAWFAITDVHWEKVKCNFEKVINKKTNVSLFILNNKVL